MNIKFKGNIHIDKGEKLQMLQEFGMAQGSRK
jgi:hypothetical protein